MAGDDVLGSVPPRFDPEKMYRVQLSAPFDYGGFVYVPGAKHTVNAELAEAMREKLIGVSEAL